MPRRPRVVLPHVPLHVIQRGNNRQACFFSDRDYLLYLEWLEEYAEETGCLVHAYALMTNHVHLLVSSGTGDGLALMMKGLGQRYVQHVNRTYDRFGTLWQGRFRSCPTQEESYLMTCHRYIELNPVRAGMVAHPADYRWSSYRANAHGAASTLLTPHSLYLSLGTDPAARQAAYREQFRRELAPEEAEAIRHATNGNYILGDARFAERVAQALGLRTQPAKPGRPRKKLGSDHDF